MYPQNRANRINPSTALNELPTTSSRAEMMMAIASRGMACSSVSLLTLSGLMTAVRPITMPILQMYEPSTLPMAKSTAPCCDAMNVTTISGIEVQKPTRNVPMYRAGIPDSVAIRLDVRTNPSPVIMIKPSPMANQNKGVNNSLGMAKLT